LRELEYRDKEERDWKENMKRRAEGLQIDVPGEKKE